jgi:FAD/FMN-containing dehydrogenase
LGCRASASSHRFAADHVRRFTIVTADGEIRDITPASDPDLFWAVRGGKSNFGIVTELEFGLVPVARFYGGCLFFPAEATAAVLHAWREWAPTLTDDVTTSVAMLRLPPDPALPEQLRGRFVTTLRFVHLGSAEEGAAVLAPMRAVATPLMDLVDEMPYTAVDAVHMDPTEPRRTGPACSRSATASTRRAFSPRTSTWVERAPSSRPRCAPPSWRPWPPTR